MIEYITVNAQDDAKGQENQPYLCCLSQIRLEGMEECFCDIAFFVSGYL